MGSNPSSWQRLSDSSSRPVEQVSWNNVADFNRRTGLRLPTEAEWEYACRAGTTTAIHSSRPRRNGSNSTVYLYNIAWFSNNANFRTHRVGRKDPNSWGFYDMIGNVQERCNDWYGSYAEGAATDPTGPTGGNRDFPVARVLRGGDHIAGAFSCRSSARARASESRAGSNIGFRVARDPWR